MQLIFPYLTKMQQALRVISFVLLAFIASGCSTVPEPKTPLLSEILSDARVVKYPLRKTEAGRWLVEIQINDIQTADMVIDTGATFSAVFDDVARRFSFEVDADKTIRVHGISDNEVTPTARVDQLGFGQDLYFGKTVAIIDRQKDSTSEDLKVDGVLGMDILSNYRVHINAAEEMLYFIQNRLPDVILPDNLIAIELYKNPFSDVAPSLHFFTAYVKNRTITALLDSGTDVHIINWHAAKFAEAQTIRSVLRHNWRVAGAVGEFKPKARANIKQFETDNYQWEDVQMIIKDTDNLKIIAVDDKPFIVAGAGLLNERDIYLDFENNKLWLGQEIDE